MLRSRSGKTEVEKGIHELKNRDDSGRKRIKYRLYCDFAPVFWDPCSSALQVLQLPYKNLFFLEHFHVFAMDCKKDYNCTIDTIFQY